MLNRRALLRTAGASVSGLSFAGCLRLSSGEQATNTTRGTAGTARTGTAGTGTAGTERDSDGDGVPDADDYAPRDPDVQRKSDVEDGNTAVETGTDTAVDTGTDTATTAQPATTPDTGSWATAERGDATTTVLAQDELEFRVVQCSRAAATKELGDRSGTLQFEFDYETAAEAWWELAFFQVFEDGVEVLRMTVHTDPKLQMKAYGSASGSVDRTVSVDGETSVRFGIMPSDYCDAGDHAWTTFHVSDLVITAR
ncbi:hypothetical protein [Haloarchaeobius sp. DYHT-AS-18]|uniref:hypothetical protein n=1 Tax=Haloarchaeobius sp. DYHT-AS-18 TaxID=3446117 RepID=UPI003EBA29D3